MDLTGFDVGKLKALAIEKWRSSPELWPVKVLSLARTQELEQKQAGRKLDSVGGYFTCARAIRSKTPKDMEEILGFQPGTFRSGVSVWKLKSLPRADQFELRGYSQTPAGKEFDGIVIRRSDLPRPQYLPKTGDPYIPGLGVEQWELRTGLLVPAIELERLSYLTRHLKWN
ncbi:MAG TPA: hypothetical protein VGS41_18150 [Chthonomonadales bacterium]|nr:hypothetical protein [Chthonomonadales bacterium]